MTSSRKPMLVAAACALVLAALGRWATELGPWYAALRRPPWQPADVWFGPVWTLIYTLAASSAVLAWSALARCHLQPGGVVARRRLLAAWTLNAVLNLAWSVLFFRIQRPDWALWEVPLLWASIALLLVQSWRARPLAGLLLLPYLGWVGFAAVLNRAVVALNAPFGS